MVQNFTDRIDPLVMSNHTDALRKLRDCPPRSSEPPDPEDPWPEGYETPGPDPPEVRAEQSKIGAEEDYDTLIQMGGRPTGPIRPTPPWKKVLVGGELCYRYAEQDETLFYSTWYGSKPDCNTNLTEAGFIAGHWASESSRCKEELRRWQGFRYTQQWRREHRPDKAREEDMERQRYPQDPHLTASLKKLKDWKEYQAYFQKAMDRCRKRIEGFRRVVEAIERKDPEVEKKCKGYGRQYWLDTIERKREWLAAEEKRLEWAKQQLPAVLSECAASLMGAPTSHCEMEERSELEAKRVFNTLVITGGRPTRPIRPVPDVQEHEHDHLHVLCHWEGECSQFEEELREWKKFLDYRQEKEADGRTEVQLEEQLSAETTTQVKLWKDYRAYQQREVDNAKQWVEFWQRQVEAFKQSESCCARQGREDEAYRYRSEGESMKSQVEDARKQVRPAEMRLEWVEEQLSALLAERAVSTTEVSTSNHLEGQAKLPKRASRSGRTTPKNHRSNRSEKSAPPSDHDKKKNGATTNSALDPIHPSRVSKTAGRKAPRRRRQSKILAEHGNGQNQGPHTTVSPLLPANVAPRRSSQLSSNKKRPGVLEASPDVDLDKSARSSPTILRRSDRISKQKERTSSVKPRGISKRHESHFSRNRTRIYR